MQNLRRILALLCITGILLVAVMPCNAWMFVGVVVPVCAVEAPTACSAPRDGVEPVADPLPPLLAASADRAPPVSAIAVL